MRFLLECVSCYGTATPDPSLEDSTQSAPEALEESRFWSSPRSPTSSAEDFVSAPRGALRRRSRSLSRLGPGDWKPSLHAISEDNVVAQAKPKAKSPASARRSGRRCASSSPRVRSHARSDSYGRDPLPMIVPAFSPTPFMF